MCDLICYSLKLKFSRWWLFPVETWERLSHAPSLSMLVGQNKKVLRMDAECEGISGVGEGQGEPGPAIRVIHAC